MKRIATAFGIVLLSAGPSFSGAVLDNGAGVRIGINDEGHLNFNDGSPPINASAWGVAFDFGGGVFRDATAPGCLCEGWGVAVNGSVSGGANVSSDGGPFGLTSPTFGVAAGVATSVVELSGLPGLTVTHVYEPSSSPSLFKATVTITNHTGGAVSDVTYRRVMDWDVPETEFNEWVRIAGLPATALLNSHDNGFCSADPLSVVTCGPLDPASEDVNYFGHVFDNNGEPDVDHGALFDFGFGGLADGASAEFNIFYGAAVGEGAIISALASVHAEVYSLGYSTVPDTLDGVANTNGVVYAFGFSGVGGEPIEPVPEPGTMLLLGAGVSALAMRRRRKD